MEIHYILDTPDYEVRRRNYSNNQQPQDGKPIDSRVDRDVWKSGHPNKYYQNQIDEPAEVTSTSRITTIPCASKMSHNFKSAREIRSPDRIRVI
uniref:Uncharacterized protein n=1 Tax=Caenorhabditis japonica TaxID=281687 RepID=A0A8R1E4Z5_CAEJA